jgi:hypothetical protein
LFLTSFDTSYSLTSFSRADPDPIYNSLDPHTYLYTRTKLRLKGYDLEPWNEHASISISPFGQNANYAKDAQGHYIPLGDIYGRWDMLALLYGNAPIGQTLPPILTTASANIFPGGLGLNDPDLIDNNQQFGFFSFPMVYRKRGVRFEVDAMLAGDFGFSIQTGIADVCQTLTQDPTPRIDLTPLAVPSPTGSFNGNSGCNVPLSRCSVEKYLMDQFKNIMVQINLDATNFHHFSIEETRFNLFWRHALPINQDEEEWPEFLIIPFAQVSGSISPGKEKDPNKAFGLAFGNNRHYSAGANAGLNMDFYDTIEIGGDFGYTHFFRRNCMELRVPNSLCQQGIFPFSTCVSYQPGANWNFGGKISAYHFLDNLSMYFQYELIHHEKDKICVLDNDPAFTPFAIEKNSDWKVHMANIGFNYDCSPNILLGLFYQMPLAQKGTYKSTTLMFTFNATF